MLTNRQRFIKNLSLLYLSNLISGLFALLVNIILIKRLGSFVYGDFAFALTFAGYFALVADSGLSPYGEAYISKNRRDAGNIVGNILSFNVVLSIVSIVLMLFLTLFVFRFDRIQEAMLILISVLPLINAFSFGWAIKGIEKNQIFSISAFIGKSVYFAMVLLLVISRNNYMLAVFSFLTGIFLTAAIQFGFIKKYIGKFRLNFTVENFKHLAVNAMPFGLVSGLIVLYVSFPILLLKVFASSGDIGFYYITNRLIVFVFGLFSLMIGGFIPVLSDSIKNNDAARQSSIVSELVRFSYTFSVPLCFGGFAVSGKLIEALFGGGFMVSAGLLKIMIWGVFFVSLSSVFFGYLTAMNDRKSLIFSSAITVIAGLAVSIAFIKEYGVYGGAVSNLAIEGIMFAGLFISAVKYVKINFNALNFAKVLAASAIMAWLVHIINADIVLSIIYGAIIYGVLSAALKILTKGDILELKEIALKRKGAVQK